MLFEDRRSHQKFLLGGVIRYLSEAGRSLSRFQCWGGQVSGFGGRLTRRILGRFQIFIWGEGSQGSLWSKIRGLNS